MKRSALLSVCLLGLANAQAPLPVGLSGDYSYLGLEGDAGTECELPACTNRLTNALQISRCLAQAPPGCTYQVEFAVEGDVTARICSSTLGVDLRGLGPVVGSTREGTTVDLVLDLSEPLEAGAKCEYSLYTASDCDSLDLAEAGTATITSLPATVSLNASTLRRVLRLDHIAGSTVCVKPLKAAYLRARVPIDVVAPHGV
eukprot:Gregarina_sp_Pseudo_9__2448@NODE_2736_length_892_cov_178_248535_g2502_i0_p1_GENE_NODE_2736_length_892_cov_178_248535_g2502_i0NODE_2736_length_892_cov_178_248535_g2502_i0_p1_ORF_typecomplete_len201_score38_00_NODE_2736_length_892_cov_178_248535_g2502_i0200802